MTAYSFKKQFIPAILDGRKTQTIRAPRKAKGLPPPSWDDYLRMVRGHVKVGGAIHIYTAMRSSHCKKIGDAVCQSVEPIRLSFFPALTPQIIIGDHEQIEGDALEAFAKQDGFSSWLEMAFFWRQEHGCDLSRWSGVLIQWKSFVPV